MFSLISPFRYIILNLITLVFYYFVINLREIKIQNLIWIAITRLEFDIELNLPERFILKEKISLKFSEMYQCIFLFKGRITSNYLKS